LNEDNAFTDNHLENKMLEAQVRLEKELEPKE
jgi:hypothetical protein